MPSTRAKWIPSGHLRKICGMCFLAVLRLELLLVDRAHDADSCLLYVTHTESPEGSIFLERFNINRLAHNRLEEDAMDDTLWEAFKAWDNFEPRP